MTARSVLLFSSILSAGLITGLWFGWMVSVIPGTARVSDRTYITTMQSVNRAIINPAFVIAFLIPPVVLGGAAIVHWRAGENRRAVWLAVGAATYLVGVLGVTFAGNVPLNNTLDTFDLATATDGEIAKRRADYEGPWNRWHALRTAASVLSLTCTAIAALSDGE